MSERYPLCLYDINGNWKTVYNEQEEIAVSGKYRYFGYDWNQKEISKESKECTSETLIQQSLFEFEIPDSETEEKRTDLLEDPVDRKHKRGRKPLKRD